MKKIITIKQLFDFISWKEKHSFGLNQFFNQKTRLKIQDENNKWIKIKSFIQKKDFILEFEFDSIENIKVGSNHLICFDKINTKKACEFTPGDTLILSNDKEVTITRISKLSEDIVYDISVDSENHLYQTANGIIHHNTLESLSLFCHFYKHGKVDSLVLIVKKHLPYQWKHEILSSTDLFTEDDILIVTNTNKHRCFDDQSKKIIIIQNHVWADSVLSYRKGAIPKKKSTLQWNSPYFDLLKVWNKKSPYLIIDESHEYKNPEAVKFMSLVPYLPFFKFRTLLTATPSTNSFVDWWSQLYIVDRGIIGMEYVPFILDIAKDIGTKYNAYDIKEYNSKQVLEYKEKFKLNVIKRLKKDIPEIKTKRIIKTVFFEPTHQHKLIYDIIREEELKRIHNDESGVRVKDVKNKFSYSLMCLDNPFLLKDKLISEANIFTESIQKHLDKWKLEYDAKILYIDDYLKEVIEEQNEKVIIFDSHPLSMDLMYERYKKYNPVIIHGETKENDEGRQNLINRFNDKSDSCKLAILSIHVASAGYNLNRGGRRILYYSLPYDGILFRQSLDRTDRANSEDDSLIEVLLYGDTLDEFRYNVVDARVEFTDTFLNKSLNEYQIHSLLKRGKI